MTGAWCYKRRVSVSAVGRRNQIPMVVATCVVWCWEWHYGVLRPAPRRAAVGITACCGVSATMLRRRDRSESDDDVRRGLERDAEWETCGPATDFSWKQIAEPVMKTYTETTDGSIIEDKESAIVWCYKDADRDFGSCQAKELHDHLESVLSNKPVSVKADLNYVEVKPQGVSKGLVAKHMLSTMQELGLQPDFILCVGDDRSDEDMFEVITTAVDGPYLSPSATVFACTIGQKPSKAKYYLDEPADIKRMIQALANVSDQELELEEGEDDPPYPFPAGDGTSNDDTWLD